MSFEDKAEVMREIKQVSSEYLSIVFARRESANVNSYLVGGSGRGMDRGDKLVLVGRKILVMHVMAVN
jgi:hypothetical protein